MPEAAVIRIGARSGDFGGAAAEALRPAADEADAVVIGPGMADETAAADLVAQLFAHGCRGAVVLDAAAMTGLDLQHPSTAPLNGNLILTPHAGEMACGRRRAP